jgi:hypothetical protein
LASFVRYCLVDLLADFCHIIAAILVVDQRDTLQGFAGLTEEIEQLLACHYRLLNSNTVAVLATGDADTVPPSRG